MFSHGMGGCPNSVDGIMGGLADGGYIVVAPKHQDCLSGNSTPDTPWGEPENWTDQSNRDRRDDIHAVLDDLPYSAYAQYVEDFGDVGCAGHSMGGYTCMGIAGAWSSWRRSEVDVVAALSPWHQPYLVQDRVGDMSNAQTLYQGGSWDIPITPALKQNGGTYDDTSPSKYFQEFNRAGHFAWTDERTRFHSQMVYYLVSFFDAYMKNGSPAALEVKKSRVKTLWFDH